MDFSNLLLKITPHLKKKPKNTLKTRLPPIKSKTLLILQKLATNKAALKK